MKRILYLVLAFCLIANPAFAADQWAKGSPIGTDNLSDLDTILQQNNASLDRLVIDYRRDCQVVADSAAQFEVKAGELAIPNSGGTVVRWRRNTSDTTVTWANIDTGAEANSTQYYVYAVGDADATTFTVEMSTNSTNPDSTTYYRKLGKFYNDSGGAIEQIVNIEADQKVIQIQYVQDGVMDTGVTLVPHDDTIPQNDEGDEYMTLDITPTDVDNILKIDVVWIGEHDNAGAIMAVSLFQDATANALKTAWREKTEDVDTYAFTHYIEAGTANTTQFKVRAGTQDAGTTTFNGIGGVQKYGGVSASSITVTEFGKEII